MKNKGSTRYIASIQEQKIAKEFGGKISPNSGASKFSKTDVIINEADMSIEAKTSMTDKESFSIKKEWLIKQKNESFAMRKSNQVLCFRFGPEQEDYYIIDDKLMRFLVEKLKDDFMG